MAEIINVTVTDSQELITVSVVDEQELIAAGLSPRGDMQKKVYDTNNNGTVDMSEDTQLFGGFTLAFLQAYLLARSNHTGEQNIDSTTTGALPLGRIEPINPLTILGNDSGGFGSTPKAMTVTELLALIGAFTFDGTDVDFTNNITVNRSYSTYNYATQTAFAKKFAPYGGGASDHLIFYLRHPDAYHSWEDDSGNEIMALEQNGDLKINGQNTRYSNVIIEGGSTRTLSESDSGKTIRYTSLSGCTVTIPDTLSEGFTCLHVQKGSVQVSFSTSGSMTLVNADSHTKTAKLHAVACTLVEATNIVNLNGYTA
jgi:hypothetical protein